MLTKQQTTQTMIAYDEGFPYTYVQEACSYKSTDPGLDRIRSYRSAEQTPDNVRGYAIACKLLDHGSEDTMADEYKIRELLKRFVHKRVRINKDGDESDAVLFTTSGAIFYRMAPNAPWATEHRIPYSKIGIAECQRLIMGATN